MIGWSVIEQRVYHEPSIVLEGVFFVFFLFMRLAWRKRRLRRSNSSETQPGGSDTALVGPPSLSLTSLVFSRVIRGSGDVAEPTRGIGYVIARYLAESASSQALPIVRELHRPSFSVADLHPLLSRVLLFAFFHAYLPSRTVTAHECAASRGRLVTITHAIRLRFPWCLPIFSFFARYGLHAFLA